jgi:hypothetical protein
VARFSNTCDPAQLVLGVVGKGVPRQPLAAP